MVGAGWAQSNTATPFARSAMRESWGVRPRHDLVRIVGVRVGMLWLAKLWTPCCRSVSMCWSCRHRLASTARLYYPALAAGIACFVEKPLARSVDDAWADGAGSGAVRNGLCCGLSVACPGQPRELQRGPAGLVTGADGQPGRWYHPGPFVVQRLASASGGSIFERVSHHIDLQRMIAGDVTSISAVRGGVPLSGRADSAVTADDVLSLTLEFASGAVGVIGVGWAPEGHPPTQSLVLHTTKTTYDLRLDPDFTLTDRGAHGDYIFIARAPLRAPDADVPHGDQRRSTGGCSLYGCRSRRYRSNGRGCCHVSGALRSTPVRVMTSTCAGPRAAQTAIGVSHEF